MITSPTGKNIRSEGIPSDLTTITANIISGITWTVFTDCYHIACPLRGLDRYIDKLKKEAAKLLPPVSIEELGTQKK